MYQRYSSVLENEGASVTEDPVTVPVQVDSTKPKSAKKRSESQGKESPTENRTRTRNVRPPDRLMLLRARDELTLDPGVCSTPVGSSPVQSVETDYALCYHPNCHYLT